MMRKYYLLNDKDFDLLTTMVDRDPHHGANGGSSQTFSVEEEQAINDAHRFFNYQVRTWISKMKDE